jgi:UDP-N-acetyl-D-glucosamine dehydrogenase
MSTLKDRIKERQAKVAVIGIGYVGLPLVVEIAKSGFTVCGFDKSVEKVRLCSQGRSYIKDVPSEILGPLVQAGQVSASNDPDILGQSDVIVICVPTPLNKTKDPDNSFIVSALDDLVPRMKKETLVILESTTFPGFTREVMVPRFEEAGYEVGKDVFIAFSPERVDPGNARYHTKNTPKVLGGYTPQCLEVARAMYGEVMERIVPVSSTDAAEMVKLLENTFRAVNIGLVNEVAIMCEKLGLDTWEVIDAAATKPFGFMPFWPGPGLGGHCIPVDPHYLSWKLKTLKYNARFIELAGEINSGMPEIVVKRVADTLNTREKAVKGSRILILGVAYKKDIDDVRESPALDVIELLLERGAQVAYHDRHIPTLSIGAHTMSSVPLDNVGAYDATLIVTDHSGIDYAKLVAESRLVIDTRNATKDLRRGENRSKIVTL